MMEFYNSYTQKAKKEHICEACQQKILIGERYQYESGKFDGQFFDRHYHLDCHNVMQNFWNDSIDDDCFEYYQVRDWWYEDHCYQCSLWTENGGTCDCDMDKKIWCTKYTQKTSNSKE